MNGLQAGRAPANSGTYPGLRRLPPGFVNFTAGMGGPIADGFREWRGIDGGVDPCSDAFQNGQLFGALQRTLSGSAAIFKGAQVGMASFTALDIGNAGANLYQNPSATSAGQFALTAVAARAGGSIARNGDTVSRTVAAALNAQSATVNVMTSE